MNRMVKSLIWLALLALLLVPVMPAQAQSGEPGKIIFGDNYTLKSGETLEGDLVVFGGNVTIEAEAELHGNLLVFGGTIASDGTVGGDVVVFGGQIELNSAAVVKGDVVTIGGQLSQADGAKVLGQVVKNVSPNIEAPSGSFPAEIRPPSIYVDSTNPFAEAFGIFSRAIVIAALAMLVITFLQPQIERVGQAIVQQPVMSGGMGLLAALGGPIALVVMSAILIVTIILIPVGALVLLLGATLLALAWLFGVIALGHQVGERFTQALNQNWAPVFSTGLGTFLVVLVAGALGQIPCVGWLISLVVAAVAIGAVVLTRFGLRSVQAVAVLPYKPPTAPESELPPAA